MSKALTCLCLAPERQFGKVFSMKRRSLHWGLWTLLCTIVVLGALALEMASSTIRIPLVLQENTTVASFQHHRFHSGPLMMALHLQGAAASSEHGSWTGVEKRPLYQMNVPSVAFPDPGIPVELHFTWKGVSHPFEAMPSSTATNASATRRLVPRLDDANPNAFGWPVNTSAASHLPVGKTHIDVTTKTLHPHVVGQTATLIIEPPVAFKYTTPGYELLWWFYFWPIYVLMLVGYGAWLLRGVRPRCKRRPLRKR